MDAEPHRTDLPEGLPGVEGEVRREGTALLLPAQPLPSDHQGTPWTDRQTVHLHGVPQQLPLDPRPHGRRLLRQVNSQRLPLHQQPI